MRLVDIRVLPEEAAWAAWAERQTQNDREQARQMYSVTSCAPPCPGSSGVADQDATSVISVDGQQGQRTGSVLSSMTSTDTHCPATGQHESAQSMNDSANEAAKIEPGTLSQMLSGPPGRSSVAVPAINRVVGLPPPRFASGSTDERDLGGLGH